MRLLYISQGNIPSKWAHTVQAMKMADAFTWHVDSVTLLTQRGLFRRPAHKVNLRSWYGVSQKLRIVQLPTRLLHKEKWLTQVFCPRFDRIAAAVARLLSPDLVYTRSPYAALLCAQNSLKTILETHIDSSSAANSQFYAIEGLAQQENIIAIVTLGEANKRAIIDRGFDDSKITTWPDAVDLERFSTLPAKHEVRKELGLPKTAHLVTYCGHLYDHKGIPALIEVARELSHLDFLIVGGWSSDVDRIKARTSGSTNIHLTGFVSQEMVPKYLAASDVLLLPNSCQGQYVHSTSPLKLFEYMAARRPIVATSIPAFSGILRHQDNAFMVKPDCPSCLRDGIEAVLKDHELSYRLVDSAWSDVQNYTWKARARDILAFAGYL